VGTGAEGKIYAAPLEEKGSLVSKPAKFDPGDKLSLAWDAAGAVRLQFRIAERSEDLSKSTWKPAEKSPAPILLSKKQAWVQYRADLESDGKTTPLLRLIKLGKE